MRHRITFELPNVSAEYRASYPTLAGLRAYCVSESSFFGLVGCDLARIIWRSGEHERMVFTAATWMECTQYLDALVDGKVLVQ